MASKQSKKRETKQPNPPPEFTLPPGHTDEPSEEEWRAMILLWDRHCLLKGLPEAVLLEGPVR